MRIWIMNLLRWTKATRRATKDAGKTYARNLPEYLIVLNDIYGVVDLSSTRR
ncbi:MULTISPECIES: hypothetical protein [Paraburkholderia]|jgi:hypothetical protein|uniref:Uncharacterized protein n=1 Tax=Paraburkholderia aspalathi TaxID=1324617 RepID=A0ABM8QD45_9BURK|nr:MULTISPECIES: hypothetical protein [Paraburkholderia]MBK3816930.1 hypothetical protein [Paraburkholderia aspalathi]MBK3828519.1 hypothetical protein [Paraburkholderia aspalathi]MBK3841571.1 hypothetical protein [Paraburkholderia aspalathi]MBK3858467.1 hypothetical protein [Paraburkholderia aspalathi]MCX4158854.1 hypothetical protein [Paraburkholderia aspalathi]